MPIPTFHGIVENGKLKIENPDRLKTYLQGLEGKISLIVSKYKKPRSKRQNAWYWSCIVKIPADHFGYTYQEMHDAFKFMFLKREEPGKPVTIGSTSSMTTVEFMDFAETCRRWCATEHSLVIPDPDGYTI